MRVTHVLVGAGNNGGGGLVAARHLSNWGADVSVTLAKPADRLSEVPASQLRALTGAAGCGWCAYHRRAARRGV